jgi:hypothetical protein
VEVSSSVKDILRAVMYSEIRSALVALMSATGVVSRQPYIE